MKFKISHRLISSKSLRLTSILLLSVSFMICCKKNEEKEHHNNNLNKKDSITISENVNDDIDKQSKLEIFDITTIDRNDLTDAFISVSDIYTDSLSIPKEIVKNQKLMSFNKLQYFELDSHYRKKMMNALHLVENDSLFIYNYELNTVQKIPISKLKSVAYLSPYVTEGEEIFEDSYMLGFQIAAQQEYNAINSNNKIAFFGNKNPFVEGQIKPIKWEKTDANFLKKYFRKSNLKLGNAYQFKYNDLIYYLQDYSSDNEVEERKLVVLKNNEKIFEKSFTRSEGDEFYPLNFLQSDDANLNQFTGYLFKNKPPVIFGFISKSFGCSEIMFLDKKYNSIYINCDNRH